MKFPQYVSTTNRTVSVVGFVDKNDTEKAKGAFQDGKGYIDENQNIWIYCGNGEPKNKNEYPYFWLDEDGKKVFSNPPELIKKSYNTDRMVDIGLVQIIENTEPNKQLFDEKEIEDMNAASSFFIPTIKETDDFLKKIVKHTIIEKGTDVNKLKQKTDEKYTLSNMIAALKNDTKMSPRYFVIWMELLNVTFDMTIQNLDESDDPLKYPITYQSIRDKVSGIVDGNLVDLMSGKNVDADASSNND